MKIAIVSDDERTISRHFGRAGKYVVASCSQENIIDRKSVPKIDLCRSSNQFQGRHGHRSNAGGSGFGHQCRARHRQAFENIKGCDMLLTRGMGRGACLELQQFGVQPVVTDIADIDAAVQAVLDGTIVDHVEHLH